MPNELDDLIGSLKSKFHDLPPSVVERVDGLLKGSFKENEVKDPALRSISELLLDELLKPHTDDN